VGKEKKRKRKRKRKAEKGKRIVKRKTKKGREREREKIRKEKRKRCEYTKHGEEVLKKVGSNLTLAWAGFFFVSSRDWAVSRPLSPKTEEDTADPTSWVWMQATVID